MEKFEIENEKSIEIFNNFLSKTKDTFSNLIDNIKSNIKKNEQAIEDTQKEINENESSKQKCQKEITKMEKEIVSLKELIDNVESTYKKIVDAYSSTSKGETKTLYSEIIDGAKSNCEKDVEKNKNEIARLEDDIDAIKNNIAEFTRIIDELNLDLVNYNAEVEKYQKALEYLENVQIDVNNDLEDIALERVEARKRVEAKRKSTSGLANVPTPQRRSRRAVEPEYYEEEEEVNDDNDFEIEEKVSPRRSSRVVKEEIEDEEEIIEEEPVIVDRHEEELTFEDDTEEKEEVVEEKIELEAPEVNLEPVMEIKDVKPEVKIEPKIIETQEPLNFEDSLKQIYDLTGYKPKEKVKEEVKEEVKNEVIENFDNIFSSTVENTPETTLAQSTNQFDESSMSEWEKILNGADDIFTSFHPEEKEIKNEPVETLKLDDVSEQVDDMLKPYGTTYSKLKNLVSDSIIYKNGTQIPFTMSSEDVVNAVNKVDATDLKSMKTLGPEITLLRKVKQMKEGKI